MKIIVTKFKKCTNIDNFYLDLQVLPFIKDRKKFLKIVDPQLKGEYPKATLKRALDMACMCLREDAKKRPPMTEVVEALEYLESQK